MKLQNEPRVGRAPMGGCPLSVVKSQDGAATGCQEGGSQESLKLGSEQVGGASPLGQGNNYWRIRNLYFENLYASDVFCNYFLCALFQYLA